MKPVEEDIKRYLEWNRYESRNLNRLKINADLRAKVIPVIDFPSCLTKNDCNKVIQSARKAGYKAANIGLSKILHGHFSDQSISYINNKLQIVSAHGSSIKYELNTGKSYNSILKSDLSLLNKHDPKGLWVVNYDIFAGHSKKLLFSKNFAKSQRQNIKFLNEDLKILSNKYRSEGFKLITHIICHVAKIFRGSGRKICFEMPGSKGWSMFPDINSSTLQDVIDIKNEYYPESFLCIDVGHILTYTRNLNKLTQYVKLLKKYKEHLIMVHLSSAGSWVKHFIKLYQKIHGFEFPLWHVKGLDLQLPISESVQLEVIKMLRKTYSDVIFEVSETRMPLVAIEDYFKGYFDINAVDNSVYHEELILQGKNLGYI